MPVKISDVSSIAPLGAKTGTSPLNILLNYLGENYPELLGSDGLTNQKKIIYIGEKINQAKNSGLSLPAKKDLDYGLNQIEADGLKLERELKDLSRPSNARQIVKPTTTTISTKTDGRTPSAANDLNVALRPSVKSTVPGLDSSIDDFDPLVKPKAVTPAPPTSSVSPVTEVSSTLKNLGDEITVITKKPMVTTAATIKSTTEVGGTAVAKSFTKSVITKLDAGLLKGAKAARVLAPLGFALDGAAMIIAVHTSDNKGQELFKYVSRTAGMMVGAKLGSSAMQAVTIETGPGALLAGAVGGAAGGVYGYVEGEAYGEESFEKLPKGVQDVFDGLGQGVSDGFSALIEAIDNNDIPEIIQSNVAALKETVSRILPFVGEEAATRLTGFTVDNAVSMGADGINPNKADSQRKVKTYTGQEASPAEGRKSTI